MLNTIGGFKFGGMVWYRHTHMYKVEILADFNLVVLMHTAKLNSPAKFSGYMVYTCSLVEVMIHN